MDNRTIDFTSEGYESLCAAIKLIWDDGFYKYAIHYKDVKLRKITHYGKEPTTHHYHSYIEDIEKGIPTLILLKYEERDSIKLPFKLDSSSAGPFVQGWLEGVEYPRQPDHDGDNGKGFRIYTDAWGHVAGHHGAIVGIQPAWAMYGK